MTDTDRAVIKAAEKCRDANRTVDLDNAMCVLIDAVDAHRAAPKLVRCGNAKCCVPGCSLKMAHRREEVESIMSACYRPEPVEKPVVPEREARRREREAKREGFVAGSDWRRNQPMDELADAVYEAAKRYPDEEPHEPDPQRGPVNVDAGPSLESRIAELERLVTYLPTYKEDLGNLARSVLVLENRISAKDGGK